jgi:hypothetical protein
MRSRRRRCLAFCVTIAGYLGVGLGHAGDLVAPATDFQLRISGDVKCPLTLNAADYRALIWLGMGPVNLKRLCDTFQCDKSADDIQSQLQYRWGYDKLLAARSIEGKSEGGSKRVQRLDCPHPDPAQYVSPYAATGARKSPPPPGPRPHTWSPARSGRLAAAFRVTMS